MEGPVRQCVVFPVVLFLFRQTDRLCALHNLRAISMAGAS